MRVSGKAVAANRAGMSLVEVIVALGIFAGALLSMGSFAGRFAHSVSEGAARTTAVELATERIETIKSAIKYSLLETQFVGTEGSLSGFPGFTRQTQITRIGGGDSDLVDYKVVTVTISTSALKTSIKKTSIISEF